MDRTGWAASAEAPPRFSASGEPVETDFAACRSRVAHALMTTVRFDQAQSKRARSRSRGPTEQQGTVRFPHDRFPSWLIHWGGAARSEIDDRDTPQCFVVTIVVRMVTTLHWAAHTSVTRPTGTVRRRLLTTRAQDVAHGGGAVEIRAGALTSKSVPGCTDSSRNVRADSSDATLREALAIAVEIDDVYQGRSPSASR